jgi:hypothetical protein
VALNPYLDGSRDRRCMEVATSLAVKDVAIFEIGEVQVITVYPLPVQWIEAATRVSMHKGSHSAMSTHVEASWLISPHCLLGDHGRSGDEAQYHALARGERGGGRRASMTLKLGRGTPARRRFLLAPDYARLDRIAEHRSSTPLPKAVF